MVGELIRELRTQRALTEEQLADRAGLSVAALSRIERGKAHPRPSTLRKLADALSIDVEVLTRRLPSREPGGSEDEVPPMQDLRALGEAAPPLLALQARQHLQRVAEDVLASLLSRDPLILESLAELEDAARRLPRSASDLGFALAEFLGAIRQEGMDPRCSPDRDSAMGAARALIDAIRDPGVDWHPPYQEACRHYGALLLRGEPRHFREAVGAFLLQHAKLAIEDLAPAEGRARRAAESCARRALTALTSVLSLFDLANGARQSAGLASGEAWRTLGVPVPAGTAR